MNNTVYSKRISRLKAVFLLLYSNEKNFIDNFTHFTYFLVVYFIVLIFSNQSVYIILLNSLIIISIILYILYYIYYIVVVPFFLRFNLYVNYYYKNISFNQSEYMEYSLNDISNKIAFTYCGYVDSELNYKNVKKIDTIATNLSIYKLLTYFLSSKSPKYISLKLLYIILTFIIIVVFIFYKLDSYILSIDKTTLFLFYSIGGFGIYSYFVYKMINSATDFYINNEFINHNIKDYDNLFILDFCVDNKIIDPTDIYGSNISKEEINRYLYVFLGTIVFMVYLPLLNDKINSIENKKNNFQKEINATYIIKK